VVQFGGEVIMKKINESKCCSLPTAHLQYDDLEELISILSAHSKQVSIIVDGVEYDSLDELKQHSGNYINNLEIVSQGPNVSLEFKRHKLIFMSSGIWLYANGRDVEGLFLRIREYILERQSRVLVFFPKFLMPLLLVGILSAGIWFYGLLSITKSPSLAIKVMVLIFFYSAAFYCFHHGHLYTISMRKKKDVESFLRRNQDQLILVIISAFVAALATVIVTRMWH
jgi:hypothetical protein